MDLFLKKKKKKKVILKIAFQTVSVFVSSVQMYCFALGITFKELDTLHLHFWGP